MQAFDRNILLWSIYFYFSVLLICSSGKKEKCFTYLLTKIPFDMVWRDLWYILVGNNVNGKIINVMRNMYHNVNSCVMVKQHMSDAFMCNMGVTQGENLSQLLC